MGEIIYKDGKYFCRCGGEVIFSEGMNIYMCKECGCTKNPERFDEDDAYLRR